MDTSSLKLTIFAPENPPRMKMYFLFKMGISIATLVYQSVVIYGYFQKYGKTPESSHFNRVWNHYIINHPFWGAIICGNTHVYPP